MIDQDTANAESAEKSPRLSNGAIDDALEAAYTVNWYLAEAWAKPEQQANALAAQNRLLNILTGGGSTAPPEPEVDLIAQPFEPLDFPKMKIAVVVGHNSDQRGAFMGGEFSEFEFDFNNRVADLMIDAAADTPTEIRKFNRVNVGSYTTEIKRLYAKVNAFEPDFIFELHFNAFDSRVGYSFVLHHYRSRAGEACAKHINDIFVAKTGFEDKSTKALSPSDRGYLSTAEAAAPCILTETWFGDYAPHVTKIGELNHGGVAALYMAAVPGIADILGITN